MGSACGAHLHTSSVHEPIFVEKRVKARQFIGVEDQVSEGTLMAKATEVGYQVCKAPEFTLVPPGEASASLIMLSGLGIDAEPMVLWMAHLLRHLCHLRSAPSQCPLPCGLRVVVPQPRMQTNAGLPAWYNADRKGIVIDAHGIQESRRWIEGLIDSEVRRSVPLDRIFLVGFSQGAAMAALTGLQHGETLGGVVAMSGRLPMPILKNSSLFQATEKARRTPFLGLFGTDDFCPENGVQPYRKYLQTLGFSGEMVLLEGLGHFAAEEEFAYLASWLSQRM